MNITNKIYDKGFRQKLMAEPKKYYKEFGNALLDDVEILVKKNTKEITYVIMPGDDAFPLEEIQAAQGPGQGCLATLSTAYASIGSICSCFSTASTISSAGSASTAPG